MRYAAAALAVAGAVMAQDNDVYSTVFSTKFFTVTSCAPEVTNCPARSTVVSSSVEPWTTSTIYTTKVHTVTSCAPTVTNCPAHSTVVVTATEAIGTTICPVTATETGAKPTATGVAPPPPAGGNGTVPAVPIPTTATGVKPVPVTTGGVAPIVSQPATLATSAASECPGSYVKTISTSITTVIPTVIYETVQIPCPTPSAPSASIPGVPTGGNGTAGVPTPSAPVTAGASGLTGSAILAAVAGVAAFALA
ncbi:GPI anchored serine-rich protein [Colletotrichum graminicola M1.001]|uniref:GPI anchored serine-rich protein n=1 Tax=Colletotrichum graminicola (strain M1.001 / M2 / FGSC 10212) TaxID=645133 RepID=E3Q810_COLGM|nr:GPI anchored serine-rich protein [Colletotrichum graminicola M1.001]EFQ27022.1 GPI anchored serine-rich protein [Colletotrichum graminicola M1.001]